MTFHDKNITSNNNKECKIMFQLTLNKRIYLGNRWTGDNKNDGRSSRSTTGFS